MPCNLSRNTPTKAYCRRSRGQPFPLSVSFADAFLPLLGGQGAMPCNLSRNTTTKAYCRRSSGGRCPDRSAVPPVRILCRCFSAVLCRLSGGQAVMPCHLSRNTNKGTLQTVKRSAVPPVRILCRCFSAPFPAVKVLCLAIYPGTHQQRHIASGQR